MEFDSKSLSLAAAAFAAAVALPLLASAGPAAQPQFAAEKCYGVAAASQNDCQTANGPNVLRLQRALSADEPSLLPRHIPGPQR